MFLLFFYYLRSNKRVRLYCYHFCFANGNFRSSVIKRLFYFISLLIRIIIWKHIPAASETNDGNVLLSIGTKYIYRYSIILLILYRNVYDVRLLKYLLKRSRMRDLEMDISFEIWKGSREKKRERERFFFLINVGLREARQKDRLQMRIL